MNVEKKIFKIDPNFRVVALAEPPSSTSSGGVGSGGGSGQQQQVGSLAIQYNGQVVNVFYVKRKNNYYLLCKGANSRLVTHPSCVTRSIQYIDHLMIF